MLECFLERLTPFRTVCVDRFTHRLKRTDRHRTRRRFPEHTVLERRVRIPDLMQSRRSRIGHGHAHLAHDPLVDTAVLRPCPVRHHLPTQELVFLRHPHQTGHQVHAVHSARIEDVREQALAREGFEWELNHRTQPADRFVDGRPSGVPKNLITQFSPVFDLTVGILLEQVLDIVPAHPFQSVSQYSDIVEYPRLTVRTPAEIEVRIRLVVKRILFFLIPWLLIIVIPEDAGEDPGMHAVVVSLRARVHPCHSGEPNYPPECQQRNRTAPQRLTVRQSVTGQHGRPLEVDLLKRPERHQIASDDLAGTPEVPIVAHQLTSQLSGCDFVSHLFPECLDHTWL